MMSKIPEHSDLIRYDYECDELNGMELACFFMYEEEEIGSREPMTGLQLEPDYPETWGLHYVYLPDGLEIIGILHEHLLQAIHETATNYFETQKGDF
jgi:hypothetical protein